MRSKRKIYATLRRYKSLAGYIFRPNKFLYFFDILNDLKGFKSALCNVNNIAEVKEIDTNKNIVFVSLFDEFYFFKIDILQALYLKNSGKKITFLISRSSIFIRYYLSFLKINYVFHENHDLTYENKINLKSIINKINNCNNITDILKIKHKSFKLGKGIISTFFGKNRLSKIDFNSKSVKKELIDLAREFIVSIQEIDSYINPEESYTFITSEKGFIPCFAIFEYCIENQIDFIEWKPAPKNNHITLKRFNQKNQDDHPFSLDKKKYQDYLCLIDKDKAIKTIDAMMNEKYKNNDWYLRDQYRAETKKFNQTDIRSLLGFDERPVCTIFSHILWDATFFYGKNLHADYTEWLIYVLKNASKNKNCQFLLKLHPDYHWKQDQHSGLLEEPELLGNIFKDIPENIRILEPDTQFNTYDIFELSSSCITVRGTAGIEMACLQKNTITGGTGRYSDLGFTHDPDNLDSLESLIKNVHNIEKPDEENANKAKIFSYLLYYCRVLDLSDYISIQHKKNSPKNPLFVNYTFNESFEQINFDSLDNINLLQWVTESNETDFIVIK